MFESIGSGIRTEIFELFFILPYLLALNDYTDYP